MKITEIFRSIEGEGSNMGYSTIFVRLFGCNLRCEWCDTTHSYEPLGAYTEMTIDEIYLQVKSLLPSSMITITGGEPFLHNDLSALCDKLLTLNMRIKIESNGTIFRNIDDNIYLCVSPKPPNYTVDQQILSRVNELKFVVDHCLQVDHIAQFKASFYNSVKCVLQPESNKQEFVAKALNLQQQLAEQNIHCAVLPQLHKLLNLP